MNRTVTDRFYRPPRQHGRPPHIVAGLKVSEEDKDLLNRCVNASGNGYAQFRLNGKLIAVHRAVATRMVGELTRAQVVDHINGDGLDNRRCNLRVTSQMANAQNRRARPNSKYRGVWFRKERQKWRADVWVNRRKIGAGHYDTREEAAAAASRKRQELGFLTGAAGSLT